MDIIRKLWHGTESDVSREEVVELTNQFYVTLRAYFARVKENGQIRNQEAFNRIDELLKDKVRNWTNAYEVEQLLIQLFEDDTIATELTIRALEAKAILSPELAAVYDAKIRETDELLKTPKDNAQAASVSGRRRTLLARIVNDLQWRSIINEATRRYSKRITSRAAYLSVVSLLAFAGLVAFIYYRPWVFLYGDLRLLPVAGLAGMWGATFSMLATLKGRLDASTFDDLKLMRSWALLISRALIGAGAACILFFFLLSGLLGGTAFPTIDEAAEAPRALPHKDLALLIVWCFIAGFSERLIPGLLATTEARATGSQGQIAGRIRPTTGTTEVPSPPDSRSGDSARREAEDATKAKPTTSETTAQSKTGEG